MNIRKSLMLLFGLLCLFSLSAAEIREGRVKLVLHENTGRFSLYYLSDIKNERYEALFVDQDPRTSFVSVIVDDKTYKLGESTVFRFRIDASAPKPTIMFESPSLQVTQEFSFIKSQGSSLSDGIRMDMRILNKGERQISAGLRFLLDTNLGEDGSVHISTDRRELTSETLISASDDDRIWYSKNDSLGLMGSIAALDINKPDSIHVANWKRLNDIPWKIPAASGRNFNYLPYSVGDSALCYYYEPLQIPRGGERTMSLLLAAANEGGFGTSIREPIDDVSRILRESAQAAESPELMIRTDLLTLRDLIDRIDRALSNKGELTDEELAAMEAAFNKMKERHDVR